MIVADETGYYYIHWPCGHYKEITISTGGIAEGKKSLDILAKVAVPIGTMIYECEFCGVEAELRRAQ